MKQIYFLLLVVIVGGLTFAFYFFNEEYATENLRFSQEKEVWLKNTIELSFAVEEQKLQSVINVNDTVFKNIEERLLYNPQFVFFIPENICEGCILKELENIERLPEAVKDNVIIITKYSKLRDVKFFVKKWNIPYPVYNTDRFFLHEASEQGRHGLFILDENFTIHHLYFPISFIEDVTERYYRMVKEKYNYLEPDLHSSISTQIEIDNKIHDFKQIPLEQKVSATFQLKNISQEPFVITKINTACGCTVPDWEKKAIPENELTTVTVEFNPEQKGIFSKKVFVFSNAKGSPHQLIITGEVI